VSTVHVKQCTAVESPCNLSKERDTRFVILFYVLSTCCTTVITLNARFLVMEFIFNSYIFNKRKNTRRRV
jgi:hypothetical protein